MPNNKNKQSIEDMRNYMDTPFELNWLELETLKVLDQLNNPVYKGEMIEILKKKHNALVKKPESSFYAVFEKLEEKGLVRFSRIEGKGYKTFFFITDDGKKELWKALNWAVSTILGKVIIELVKVLRNECVKRLSCSVKMNFGTINPNNSELLIGELCNKCVNAKNDDTFHRFNIIMPFAPNNHVEGYQNILATPANIPLKDNFLDRVLSAVSLGLLDAEQGDSLIKEIKRILRPGGKVGFYEVKKFESHLFDALNRVTHGFNLLVSPKQNQSLTQFEIDELKEKIGKVFDKDKIEVVDLKEIVLVIAEK